MCRTNATTATTRNWETYSSTSRQRCKHQEQRSNRTLNSEVGKLAWIDLTVPKGTEICEFYKAVVGWDSSPVNVGDYDDYCVHPPGDDEPVAGICHRRGSNETMPAQWMVYITVADLDQSMESCEQRGGKVLVRARDMGSYGRMSVIQDPAGAVCALMQPPFD